MIDDLIAKQDEVFDGDIEDFTSAEDFLPDMDVEEEAEELDINSLADDAPIVKFVNKVLFDAIKMAASDIHFEPYEKEYRIRIRSDGILREVVKPPKGLSPRLAARLKVMARLDISERRAPQDGRIQLKLSKNRSIDFRVSTLPTLFGEKIVLRILDPGSARMGVDALGYEEDQKKLYLDALDRPQGMILVTGPTGSGKTVSLYTGLDILNEPERNISTAEDPVEINMEGVNQVHVNPKVGTKLCAGPAIIFATRSGCFDGGRDPGSRDCRDCGQGRADRTPCTVDATHQQRTRDHNSFIEYGGSRIQHSVVGIADHCSTTRQTTL